MVKYLENRLNEFETYTYSLKLYMINPGDFNKLDKAISDGSAILLADNASIANYNISDVEQIFVSGHNQVRETFGNNFTVRISEANGVTLLNTLKLVSLKLGIESHLQAGYIMSIEFRGRTHSGRAKKYEQTFLYPLKIKWEEYYYSSKNFYLRAKRMQITKAKSDIPSISAAAIIIDVLISPAASG